MAAAEETYKAITLPAGVDQETNDLVNRLLKQLHAKAPRNRMRKTYYDGKKFSNLFRSGVVPPQYQTMDMVLGWSAKAVDILARRCNLDGFIWPDGDIDSLGSQDQWDDNYFGSTFNQGAVDGLIHAVAFLVNTPGGADEPPSLLHFKDALNATGDWDFRLRRLENLISVNERNKDGDPTAITLYRYNVTDSWALNEDSGRWEEEAHTEHTFGVPADPLPYKPRITRPFGSSRISRVVMSLQNQALRTVIRMEGHLDVYSFPEFWMLGADSSVFKNPDGTLKPEWQVMLGRIKGIPDDDEAENPRADVKQFPGNDPTPHIMAYKQQAQMFSGETSIPLTSLGVADMANPTSADSYVASREDLIAEAEGTTDDWAPALRRRWMTGLAMRNGLSSVPPEWKSIQPKFRSPVYLSRAAQADAGAKTIAANPALQGTEVGYELSGLDEQQIQRVMSEQRRQGGRAVLEGIQQRLSVIQGGVPGAGNANPVA